MSEWIDINDRLPPDASNGVWDAVSYLCALNNSDLPIIALWMNNRFHEFPAGATKIICWMELPKPPNKPLNEE